MDRIVGILGGMGPQATVDLMDKIIRATPAREEADHVHMIVECNPTVPPRTRALLEGGASPGPELARMARRLVTAGASVLAIPCNTAHAFITDITAAVDQPVLNMIELAANEVQAIAPGTAKVGLLATRGTRWTRLYHDRLERRGWTVIDLKEREQERLDSLLANVKTRAVGPGERAAMHNIITDVCARGAGVVIAGCTEVPLLLPDDTPVAVLDPADILARAVVAYCKRGAAHA